MRQSRCVGCFCRRCGIENSTAAAWLHLSPAFCSRRLHSTCTPSSTHHWHSITLLWPVPDFALSEWRIEHHYLGCRRWRTTRRSSAAVCVRRSMPSVSTPRCATPRASPSSRPTTSPRRGDALCKRCSAFRSHFSAPLAVAWSERPSLGARMEWTGQCPPGCGSAQHGRLPSLPPCIEHAAEPDTLF